MDLSMRRPNACDFTCRYARPASKLRCRSASP